MSIMIDQQHIYSINIHSIGPIDPAVNNVKQARLNMGPDPDRAVVLPMQQAPRLGTRPPGLH
jgi:hypothetical protein